MKPPWTTALGSLLVAVGCEARVDAEPPPVQPTPVASEEWVRVLHPEHPFSVELPEDTVVYHTGQFSLGWPEWQGRARADFPLFGIRPIPGRRVAYHALQIAFFWVTDAVVGADPATLKALARRSPEPAVVTRFLRGVLYRDRPVDLADRGSDRVGGYPARRTAVTWRAAPGTPDERAIEGEVVLVPVSPLVALVVIVRFDHTATPQERTVVWPRVLDSVRLEDALRTSLPLPLG